MVQAACESSVCVNALEGDPLELTQCLDPVAELPTKDIGAGLVAAQRRRSRRAFIADLTMLLPNE